MNNQLPEIAGKMKDYFGADRKRINHALRVADYAAKILVEEAADRDLVMAAAYLHDIGIPEAERKYNSAGGKYQEKEGPPIARDLLRKLGLDPDFIENVCAIIAKHHTYKGLETKEFQILYEADWLVNLQEDFVHLDGEKKKKIINKHFQTAIGRILAEELLKKPG